MRKLRELLWLKDFQALMFFVFLGLFFWPFLARGVFGSIKALFAYYFAMWFCAVCFLAFVSLFKDKGENGDSDGEE